MSAYKQDSDRLEEIAGQVLVDCACFLFFIHRQQATTPMFNYKTELRMIPVLYLAYVRAWGFVTCVSVYTFEQ